MELDNWIENSSTIFGGRSELDSLRSLELLTFSDDEDGDDDSGGPRRFRKSYEAVFEEIDPYAMQCKHFRMSKKLYTPRTFQHHRLTKIMRANYELQGYDVKKNYQCPKSACQQDQDPSSPAPCGNRFEDLNNLAIYRYMRVRKKDGAKQVMCRLCSGVNWIDTCDYFKHLFLAHGLISKFNRSTAWYKKSEELILKETIENYYTVFIESTSAVKFCRNVFPLISLESIPLPIKYYSDLMSSGFRRTHVLCTSCRRYIRIGWCEHDEIIRRQYEDFESLNIATFKEYARLSYVQTRKREEVEGIYENYFVHYVDCNFSKYDSSCLYVTINN